MMDYIKKLRACIRAFQELDTNHVRENLEQSKQIEVERQRHLQAGFNLVTSVLIVLWTYKIPFYRARVQSSCEKV